MTTIEAAELIEACIAQNPADADNILTDLILALDTQDKEVKKLALNTLLTEARIKATMDERARFRAQFVQEEALPSK